MLEQQLEHLKLHLEKIERRYIIVISGISDYETNLLHILHLSTAHWSYRADKYSFDDLKSSVDA